MKHRASAVALLLFILTSSQALAWGERGHRVVAEIATRLVGTLAPATEAGADLGGFFLDRREIMGHLSNIPDTAWRNATEERRIEAVSISHHYFGPERVLSAPEAAEGPSFEAYLARVRRLPARYEEFKARYDGSETPLPGVPAAAKKLRVYEDVGVTPWRAQELYDLLVDAFRCAKDKEGRSEPTRTVYIYAPVPSPFRLPSDATGETTEPPLPTYFCQPDLPRESDLHAAVILAGTLAHFVGDQGQPYHPTADYDGWVTGNGGIHGYFESRVVRALDEGLNTDVWTLAGRPAFQEQVWENVGAELDPPAGVAQVLINMAADAVRHKERVRQIDDQVALLARSEPLEWGDYPWRHPGQRFEEAKRAPADRAEVTEAFRPLIVERLATSAVVLARLWVYAWQAAGEPYLGDQTAVSLPYPHQPPFIWPAFDEEALNRSRKAQESQYPSHWWTPVPEEDHRWWEIVPQEAGPGEVVLSKRNELGIFSNFAHTPFYFHGKRYESTEGFWYMLAYPEGPEDPRMQNPNIKWKHTREEVSQMVGFQAKNAGGLAEANMAALGINWVTFEGQRMKYMSHEKGTHYKLIRQVLWEKVRQNPKVRELLLSTGDLKLLPDNFDSLRDLPAWRYFDIHTEIRDTLRSGRAAPPTARYPEHWWEPIPEEEKQWWEILPQAAGLGEVILSKRNELGIFSNFAPTAFTLHGQRYASVEGFWQSLLYPEGPQDPRAQFPGLTWKHTREEVTQMTAFEAKNAGSLAEENMKKMGIDWVTFEGRRMTYWTPEKGDHYRIIVAAMRAKLEQNPEVGRLLLATGDLVFKPDHIQEPNAPPAWEYFNIWMELRSELREKTGRTMHVVRTDGSLVEF